MSLNYRFMNAIEQIDPKTTDLLQAELPEFQAMDDLTVYQKINVLLPFADEQSIERWEESLGIIPIDEDLEERRRYLMVIVSTKIKVSTRILEERSYELTGKEATVTLAPEPPVYAGLMLSEDTNDSPMHEDYLWTKVNPSNGVQSIQLANGKAANIAYANDKRHTKVEAVESVIGTRENPGVVTFDKGKITLDYSKQTTSSFIKLFDIEIGKFLPFDHIGKEYVLDVDTKPDSTSAGVHVSGSTFFEHAKQAQSFILEGGVRRYRLYFKTKRDMTNFSMTFQTFKDTTINQIDIVDIRLYEGTSLVGTPYRYNRGHKYIGVKIDDRLNHSFDADDYVWTEIDKHDKSTGLPVKMNAIEGNENILKDGNQKVQLTPSHHAKFNLIQPWEIGQLYTLTLYATFADGSGKDGFYAYTMTNPDPGTDDFDYNTLTVVNFPSSTAEISQVKLERGTGLSTEPLTPEALLHIAWSRENQNEFQVTPLDQEDVNRSIVVVRFSGQLPDLSLARYTEYMRALIPAHLGFVITFGEEMNTQFYLYPFTASQEYTVIFD